MTELSSELHDVVRQLRAELEWVARTGVEAATTPPTPAPAPTVDEGPNEPSMFARPPPSAEAPSARATFDRPPTPPPAPTVDARPEASVARGAQQANRSFERPSLEQIRADLGDCTRCKLHQMGRRQIVFGVGNPDAALMFVGEGPGGDEDRIGEPFVGAAGQLLTKIIQGMKMQREEVYIANIVKCRPPRNRDPEPDEVEQCEPFLRAQIDAVQPQVIVALGRYAAQALLRTNRGIMGMRGNWASYQDIPVMPTLHPEDLLRNASGKRPVWEDMKAVLRHLGREVPSSGRGR